MGEFAKTFGVTTRTVAGCTVSALTQEMKGIFEVWCEEQAIAKLETRQAYMDEKRYAEFYEMTTELINGDAFTWGARICRTQMRTPRGSAKLLQIMLMPAHPDVTEEEARKLFDLYPKEINAACEYLLGADPNSTCPEGEAAALPGHPQPAE